MQYGHMPSDVNTEEITIQVKCTNCGKVESTKICAESLADYTLNEDGETYTSLYGECAECISGEDTEECELPEEVTDDPRIGKPARAKDGCTGVVDSVYRFADGYEVIHISNKTGVGHSGSVDSFTFFE